MKIEESSETDVGNKSFIEFLQVLTNLNQANLDFIKNITPKKVLGLEKYKNELGKVQDLINSFEFKNDPSA
ncbi:MAG TPA: hypothetical protein VKZ95_00895 [Sphingobacteriaceae bacterium]|nr:hypothetical protein [Sphingobacteriaceae bacterium]